MEGASPGPALLLPWAPSAASPRREALRPPPPCGAALTFPGPARPQPRGRPQRDARRAPPARPHLSAAAARPARPRSPQRGSRPCRGVAGSPGRLQPISSPFPARPRRPSGPAVSSPATTHLSRPPPLLVLPGPARLLPHAAILETLGSQMSPPTDPGPAALPDGKCSSRGLPGPLSGREALSRADYKSHSAPRHRPAAGSPGTRSPLGWCGGGGAGRGPWREPGWCPRHRRRAEQPVALLLASSAERNEPAMGGAPRRVPACPAAPP